MLRDEITLTFLEAAIVLDALRYVESQMGLNQAEDNLLEKIEKTLGVKKSEY